MSPSLRWRQEVSSDGSCLLISSGEGTPFRDVAGSWPEGTRAAHVGEPAAPRAGVAAALSRSGCGQEAVMSLESQECEATVHDLAVARHLEWAQDFAIAGDHASAVDELLDAQALRAELRVS